MPPEKNIEMMTIFRKKFRPRSRVLDRAYAMVTVKNRLMAVPQTVMKRELPKPRRILFEEKMYS